MEDLVNPISPKTMMPAVAQGIIGIEQRLHDTDITDLISPLNHNETMIQVLTSVLF